MKVKYVNVDRNRGKMYKVLKIQNIAHLDTVARDKTTWFPCT